MMNTQLLALNKPYGVICQFSQHDRYPSLKNYVPIPDVYPAGRLDTDSEGLLLLTNDGRLQKRIIDPHHKLPKTYWVQVEGVPNESAIQHLSLGVDLGDFKTRPADVRLPEIDEINQLWNRNPPIRFRKTVPDFWLEITIREGKNRQVRRMCAKVGLPCLRLVRVKVGPYDIFDLNLKPGQYTAISTRKLMSYRA